jgi:acetyl-CoA carboxylase biotin carboxyl carrier protein
MMSQKNLTYQEIVSLIEHFEASSEFNRLYLKYFDLEIELEKKGARPKDFSSIKEGVSTNHSSSVLNPINTISSSDSGHSINTDISRQEPEHDGLLKITSTMVGTFYASPEPGAPPFVTLGQQVIESTQVCIIEVMKLMSSIEAGVNGTIVEIMVKNNDPVEFGQVLFWVKPD